MKNPLFIILLLCSTILSAQHVEITKLLNEQFRFEQKMYDNADPFKPKLIQPFEIKNDTLSFEFSIPENEYGVTEFVRREVYLKDIEAFIKDINIIFITKSNNVKEITTFKNGKGEVLEKQESLIYLFYTELRKDASDGETFRFPMVKAFENAGYSIVNEDWYD